MLWRHQGVAACICLHRNPPAFLPYIFLELNQYIRLKTSEAPNEHRSLFARISAAPANSGLSPSAGGECWHYAASSANGQAMFRVNYMRTLLATSKVPAYSVYIANSPLVLCTEGRVLRHKCQTLPALFVSRFAPCFWEALIMLPPASVAARLG